MKKRMKFLKILLAGFLAFTFIILAIGAGFGEESNTVTDGNSAADANSNANSIVPVSPDVPNKGYQCLESKIDAQSKLSFEQAIFAGLAVGKGKNDKILNTVKENKKSNEACWPAGGCRLKESAQVALYYNRIGESTEDIVKWIESKSGTATGLKWYLEIDILEHTAGECTVGYDDVKKQVQILNDMKIGSGAASGCFAPSTSGYWLQLSDSCVDKSYEITCNRDFLTTLLYEKRNGGTIYVSPETHNAAQDARTTEKIEAKCFKTGSECDYEGSLWATMALSRLGKDMSSYVPYLQALEDENLKNFPSAFIYFIQPAQEQYGKITEQQKPGKFWEVLGSPYKKYYDTSLAILALDRSSAVRTEVEQAKNYLASSQLKDGCWNSRDTIIDTAFILFSAWPKGISGGVTPGGGTTSFCSSIQTASCETDKSACQAAGGKELTIYTCLKANEFCCSVKVPAKTCADQKGALCKPDEECLAETLDSSDAGICCSAQCAKKAEPITCPATAECKSACGGDEEEQEGATCSNGEVCCALKENGGEKNNTWIIILIILIAIVVILIIFRSKIQLAWYNWRGRVKSSPVTRPGSGGVSSLPVQGFGPRPPFTP